MLDFLPIGIKTNIETLQKFFAAPKGGFLFDDTPRGLLEALLISGGMVTMLTFAPTLIAVLSGIGFYVQAKDRARKSRLSSSFQYLKQQKYVRVITSKEGRGIRIEVTEKGRQRAVKTRLRRALLKPVERPRAWDRRWRIIMFDIASYESSKRSAFRGLIRRLGAVMLQKSVWIYPFDCSEQVEILKSLFDLSDKELRLVVARTIGDDASLRKHFQLP